MVSTHLASPSTSGPLFQRIRQSIVGIAAIATLLNPGIASARIVLSDQALDEITAGTTSLSLTLSLALTAYASGVTATTSTEGLIRTAETTILSISVDPGTANVVTPRLVDEEPADIVVAWGQAKAAGDAGAQCSATINNPLSLAFVVQTQTQSISTTSALCSCSLFGISLLH